MSLTGKESNRLDIIVLLRAIANSDNAKRLKHDVILNAAADELDRLGKPDHVYDPADWESTIPWQERDQLAADCEVEHSGITRFHTLIDGPVKFCVYVNGEYCWFNTLAEAEAAWRKTNGREGD